MSSNGNPLRGYSFEDVLTALERAGWPETVYVAPREWLSMAQAGGGIQRDADGPFIMIGPCNLRPKGTKKVLDVSASSLFSRPVLVREH